MAERTRPQPRRATVLRTERITPHMIRVTLGGDGLADFGAGAYTDHYVKILFAADGGPLPEPFDLEAIRRDQPREEWPRTRTYTVRSWNPATVELTIDFVHHGDEGLAGPWAARAVPGDVLYFSGPGGGYTPDPTADWHLLVGDESALPAIAAGVERLPAGAPAHVFVEVADAEEEQKLDTYGAAEIHWVHRGDRTIGEALVEAVRALEFPAGRVHAFVHGEATFVKDMRRELFIERGVPRAGQSISGYWRRGADEDGWQSSKKEWNQQVEEEEARASAS
ncbi:siderophore-interacting protein [Longispora sp. K20-0274]|uniref:siderophore-interacting protein n=1 Tax=Longispora sp. K20-0274 TaxID=3088255 RepID=UPI00399969E1